MFQASDSHRIFLFILIIKNKREIAISKHKGLRIINKEYLWNVLYVWGTVLSLFSLDI